MRIYDLLALITILISGSLDFREAFFHSFQAAKKFIIPKRMLE